MLQDLEARGNAKALPVAYETVAFMSDPLRLPAVESPEAWIKNNVLARWEVAGTPQRGAKARGPRRSTLGKKFFDAFQVGKFVRHEFNPRETFPDEQRWAFAPKISHFAGGARNLVLVEPLVLSRGSYKDDVKTVVADLSPYRAARSESERIWTVAMFLPEAGVDSRREEARSGIAKFVDEVVDAHRIDELDGLFERLFEAANAA